MTFEEWWESIDKGFSRHSIRAEVKWFTQKAWNAAVNEMIKQEGKASPLLVVVRTGVYDRGIVGVYDNADLAYQGFIEAKNYEKDIYHEFEIRKYELNKTIDFNNCGSRNDEYSNYSPPYYGVDNCIELKEE